jgi:hypothetical protein
MMSSEELRAVALALPDRERAGLAYSLLLSLPNDIEGEQSGIVAYPDEYEDEIERRAHGFERGEIRAVSKEQLFQRMQARV